MTWAQSEADVKAKRMDFERDAVVLPEDFAFVEAMGCPSDGFRTLSEDVLSG